MASAPGNPAARKTSRTSRSLTVSGRSPITTPLSLKLVPQPVGDSGRNRHPGAAGQPPIYPWFRAEPDHRRGAVDRGAVGVPPGATHGRAVRRRAKGDRDRSRAALPGAWADRRWAPRPTDPPPPPTQEVTARSGLLVAVLEIEVLSKTATLDERLERASLGDCLVPTLGHVVDHYHARRCLSEVESEELCGAVRAEEDEPGQPIHVALAGVAPDGPDGGCSAVHSQLQLFVRELRPRHIGLLDLDAQSVVLGGSASGNRTLRLFPSWTARITPKCVHSDFAFVWGGS